MRTSTDIKKIITTQTALAKALGLSVQRIQQLVKDGIVVRDNKDKRGGVYLLQSLRNYYQMKNRRKSPKEIEVDYQQEKALHEAANRKLAEIRLAKMEQRVFDATVVELVEVESFSTFRMQLQGLPAKLSPQMEHKASNEIEEVLTREIMERLDEIPRYSPDLYTEEALYDDNKDD